jgi:hypothetical protein
MKRWKHAPPKRWANVKTIAAIAQRLILWLFMAAMP